MRLFASLATRLSGGTHPRAVSLAVFLGLLAGFIQGWNLSLAALFVLIVLLDVRSRVAITCWMIGLGLSWLLAPVTFLLGRVVLDLTPLGTYLGQLADGRVAALFGWDRYTVVGGLLIGLAIAWPASSLLTRGVRRTRRLLHSARELRARLSADEMPAVIAFPRSRISRRARFADWLRGRNAAAPQPSPERLFRPGGLPAAAAVAAAVAAIAFWQVPRLTSGRLYLAMQAANQARLEAGTFDLALWNGRLEIHDLRLADPNCLTHDRLRVAQLRADIDPAALLRGCLAVKRLDLTGVRTHVERACAAAPLASAGGLECVCNASSETLAPLALPQESPGVEACLTHWSEVQAGLSRLGAALAQIQRLQDEHRQPTLPLSLLAIGQTDLTSLRQARSGLGRPLPTIAVASMRVEDLDPSWQLGNGATLQAENLSNEAGTGPAAARLAIDAPNCGMRLLAEYAPHFGRPRWTMRIDARNLSVARQLSNTTRQQALALDGGQVSLTGLGWADVHGFEMPLQIHGRDLACHAMGQHKLAGIRGDHWATGLARLGDFKIQAVCRGSWTAPRFEVDPSLAAEQFRQQLHLGGQQELLAQIDLQANPTTGREAMPGLEPAASTEIATANPAAETTMVASQPSVPTPPQSTPAPNHSSPSTPAPLQVATAPTIEPTANGPTSASPGTPSTAPLEVPAAIAAAPAAPATDLAAQSAGTTTAQAAQAPHDAPPNDMPVIEVGHPGPAFPAGTTVAPETTPVVAAVGTPLQGPGPVDLTVGYDQSTELWHPPAPPTEAIAVEPPRTPVTVPRANPPSGDAEFDEWNAEQEQLESRRERALAQLPANSDSLTSDEPSTTVIELEPQEAKPSWFARMRGYFRRGKEPAAGRAFEEQTPAHSFDPPEYIARGQRELPATGGATKLR